MRREGGGNGEGPPLRCGLVGCGGIGRLRASALSRAGGLRLIAVSDVDDERAAEVSARHGAVVEPDWRALIRRRDVDAVVVSTPPSLHAEMCVEALRAGKHVLCEKPLARTSEESRAILRAADESQRFVGTGFNYRFFPSVQKARELLDRGVIGELDHVRGYAGYSAADHDHAWLHDADVMGGGALRDNGIHLIDLVCHFLGEVSEVTGFASNFVWNFDRCEDNGFALLRSRAGRVASIHASWTEWRGYRLQVDIYGTRGLIRLRCFPMVTQVTWAAERGGATRRRVHLFPRTHLLEHVRSYRAVVVESFVHELRAFVRAVRGEPSTVATGGDGLRAIEIAEAATRPPVLLEPRVAPA